MECMSAAVVGLQAIIRSGTIAHSAIFSACNSTHIRLLPYGSLVLYADDMVARIS